MVLCAAGVRWALPPAINHRLRYSLYLERARFSSQRVVKRFDTQLINRPGKEVFRPAHVRSFIGAGGADNDAVAEFEMLTLSYYQKLNEERQAILEAFHETGRAYAV